MRPAHARARYRPYQTSAATCRSPGGVCRAAMHTENMAKKMLIDATHAEETRVVVVDGNKVEEFDFESENKRQLAGNIYLAKVTRVEPSLQAAFVDYGGNRHGFLAFSEIHPDYYQIPVADREALLEEERAYAEAQSARDEEEDKPRKRPSRRRSSKAQTARTDDAVTGSDEISGMETIDPEEDGNGTDEGLSPMETVAETPVEEPAGDSGTRPEETAEKPGADNGNGENGNGENGNGNDNGRRGNRSDAAAKDESIESVADDDDSDDIRPPRKPRPRRYKIQEVIKVRQILLVQVVKEERGNKGAALTTYLSLAGRYCVLMPNTARGGGISRKITNAPDRKKLKEIANEIDVPQGAGLIIRTAGAKRTNTEIKRDYEYLQRLWEQIRELTLKSIAPAKIYEEGDLIKRSIRDLYNREIDEVLVEGERGYRIAKDFMKMIMPSHAKNVKHYHDTMPLFARHQVESTLAGMFNPSVQLASGGYIVIGVTEALVAVDVNSGRATKKGSIEETALQTNLEAADEVARQLRLRDLAGLIVIDFIDMDERRNNASVEKRMKERLKTDRARIQVGRISGFGLMEMSRQRLRPGMIEATTQPCPACHGTGLIRSDDSLALSILRQVEEEGVRRRSREVLLKCPVGIANYLMNQKREHVAQIEARYGLSVRIEGDPVLVSPDFTMEKFKTATRTVPEPDASQFVSAGAALMVEIDETEDDVIADEVETTPVGNGEEGDKPKKKRRRSRSRGRRKSKSGGDGPQENGQSGNGQNGNDQSDETGDKPQDAPIEASGDAAAQTAAAETAPIAEQAEAEAEAPKPKPKRPSRSRKKTPTKDEGDQTPAETEAAPEAKPEQAAAEKPKPKPRSRSVSRKKKEPEADGVAADPAAPAEPAPEPAPEPVAEAQPASQPETQPEHKTEPAPEPVAEEPVNAPEPEPEPVAEEATPAKPKRRGWWSLGG